MDLRGRWIAYRLSRRASLHEYASALLCRQVSFHLYMEDTVKLSPKIYCVGRRRIYPTRTDDGIELELTLERSPEREDHLARLPLSAAEARKLHRAIGTLLKKA